MNFIAAPDDFAAASDAFSADASPTSPDTEDTLPCWDMSMIYPGLDSPGFAAGFQNAVRGISELETFFDERGIAGDASTDVTDATGAQSAATARCDDATIETFEAVTTRYNALLDEVRTLRAYISAFVSTDSRDEEAQARMSELRREFVPLSLLGTRFTAWIGTLDIETLIERSALAQEHTYLLRKTRARARHLMPPGEESLAAELRLGAGAAWSKLHSDMTSQLLVPFNVHDPTSNGATPNPKTPNPEPETLPMSVIRALATDPDREVRRRAYEAELSAWEKVEVPLAAAMNSLKHETNTLAARRGWDSALDIAVFENNIDRETLDAMMGAARDSFPDFRRYLRLKARVVSNGQADQLPWHDLFAPLGQSRRVWGWSEAEDFVAEQFKGYSSKMGDFARRTYREGWIDAGPRPGKGDGAFCMGLRRDESRILHNYKPAFSGVSTLAHELGHAYHNLCLAERSALQSQTPMTLAETASIFCETIIRQAALQAGERDEQIAILEASLQGACQVVVDITSRFLFESRVLEKRRERELSPAEMCEMMLQAQRETYGNGLDPDALHPYMWAVKGHYYGSTFYNFPYMFGLLFGLGLYAQYEKQPDGFHARYDALLSSTGMADAATLARDFGIDLHDGAFWNASFDLIRQDITRLEQLLSVRD